MKKKLAVQFSGGRTSAYMCKWLLDNMSYKYDMTFCFQNTGQEHENTLKFIDQCDKAFGLNLYWIEAVVKEKGVGTSYKIVDFNTAKRQNDSDNPFENIVKKFGLPNQDFPHCTRELKIAPFKKFAIDQIGSDYIQALGIRVDESERAVRGLRSKLKKQYPKATFTIQELIDIMYLEYKKYYPLILDRPKTKEDILLWWRAQSFDLEVPEHLGNCMNCWKKSDRKLYTIAEETPEVFNFTMMIESKYGLTSNFGDLIEEDRRFMFRGNRLSSDIIRDSKTINFKSFKDAQQLQASLDFEDCAEECGSVWND